MKTAKTIILLALLTLAWTVCVAEGSDVPENAIFEWKCKNTDSDLWSILHPDEAAIIKKPRVFLPEEEELRSCINQFKAIIHSDVDTLFLFVRYTYIYDYFYPKEYFGYGWTNRGDTLMLGTSSYLDDLRKELPNAPIMKYISEWDEKILSTYYWPYGIGYVLWTGPSGCNEVVFRIVINETNIYIQGIEVDYWDLRPKDIERRFSLDYQLEDYIKIKTY